MGINDFQTDLALVENVETRHDSLNFIRAIFCVDDLLFETVLIRVIENEIRGKAVIQERVLILEDDLNFVNLFFIEVNFVEKDAVVVINYLLWFEYTTVDAEILDGGAVVVELEVLAISGETFDKKGQLDHSLINVTLVKVHDDLVQNV